MEVCAYSLPLAKANGLVAGGKTALAKIRRFVSKKAHGSHPGFFLFGYIQIIFHLQA